jgi:hypothetical protein
MNKYYFCGREYDEEIEKRIKEYFQAEQIRVLHENDIITCEARSGRVNIILNDNNYIVDITEG